MLLPQDIERAATVKDFRAIDLRVAYKFATPAGELATLRFVGLWWMVSKNGAFAMTHEEALGAVTMGKACHGPDFTVKIFACYCAKCLDSDDLRAFQGLAGASHGLWPECYEVEAAKLRKQMEEELEK